MTAQIIARILLILGAGLLMHVEGQYQNTPGFWFAVGAIMIAIALLPWDKQRIR